MCFELFFIIFNYIYLFATLFAGNINPGPRRDPPVSIVDYGAEQDRVRKE